MSDMEKGSSLHGWHKRMEALVALALSRATGAFSQGTMRAVSLANLAPLAVGSGPGSAPNQITWPSAPFAVAAGGKVQVFGAMATSAANADGSDINFQLVRDPGLGEVVLSPSSNQQAGAAPGLEASSSLLWFDSPPAGAHVYAIRATNNSAAVLAVGGAGKASVSLMLVT
jgi:hypothetical protein